MNEQSRALVHAITGPIILITVGSLFALDRFADYPFTRTWPVLLIVIGCLRLFGGGRRWRYQTRYAAPPPSGAASSGATSSSQQPPPGSPQGGYR